MDKLQSQLFIKENISYRNDFWFPCHSHQIHTNIDGGSQSRSQNQMEISITHLVNYG